MVDRGDGCQAGGRLNPGIGTWTLGLSPARAIIQSMISRIFLTACLLGAIGCAGPTSAKKNEPVVATPAPVMTIPSGEWWTTDAPCPEGASLRTNLGCEGADGKTTDWAGDSPCEDTETLVGGAWCELADGADHGPQVYMQRAWTHHGWPQIPESPKGRKGTERYYLNGEKHGTWRAWFLATLMFEGTYNNGVRDGHFRKWNNNRLVFDGTYRSGIPVGRFRYWNMEDGELLEDFTIVNGTGTYVELDGFGQRIEQTKYKSGKHHGLSTKWRQDGTRKSESSYANGKLHGLRREWTSEGVKTLEESYTDGLANGVFRYWTEEGKLLGEFEMTMGTGIWIEWDYSGEMNWRCTYKAGKKHGPCSEPSSFSYLSFEYSVDTAKGRYENGLRVGDWAEFDGDEKRSQGPVRAGKRFGKWTLWRSTGRGRYRSVGVFRDEKREGAWITWDEDGTLTIEEIYVGGIRRSKRTWSLGKRVSECSFDDETERHGICSKWHENGQIESVCGYAHGRENGLCQRWYENGQLESRIEFDDGYSIGTDRTWYSNGQIERETNSELDIYRSWGRDGEEYVDDDEYDDDD